VIVVFWKICFDQFIQLLDDATNLNNPRGRIFVTIVFSITEQ
jgi:hypothetical protein